MRIRAAIAAEIETYNSITQLQAFETRIAVGYRLCHLPDENRFENIKQDEWGQL